MVPSLGPLWERAEPVAEIIELKRRVSRLEEAVRLLDKVLSLVPTQQQMPSSVRNERGYFFAGSSQNITDTKNESGEIISRTVSIKQATLPLNGIPIQWKLITALRQELAICLDQCNIEYPDSCNIVEEKLGEQTLLHETAWRCCMQGLRSRLQWELKEAEAASNATGSPDAEVNPPDTSLVSADQLGAFAGVGGKVIRDALKKATCKPSVESTGKGNPHWWRYCDAIQTLRAVKSGKLRSFNWPDSAAEVMRQKDSNKIPAKKMRR